MKRFFGFSAIMIFLFCALGCCAEVLMDPVTGKPIRYAGKFGGEKVTLPDHYSPRLVEMRGVWVATIENIDFAKHERVSEFKRDFIRIVDQLKKANFNTLFFQVRPMNDAFYPSQFNPWSRWMTGQEGKSLGSFDPLAFMVTETHKRGLEFHAWLNPYRVNARAHQPKETYLKTLDPKNFARRNPHMVLESKLGEKRYSLFLDPGRPEVVAHIKATVEEIVSRYNVDGIHFDDYFYLYSDIGRIDEETYRAHNPDNLSLAEWRRSNVDRVVSGTHELVEAASIRKGRKISFGISPFGIWANRPNMKNGSLTGGKQSYFAQFADTRGWVKKGWIDYIAPQLYWPFGHEIAAYAALADWWSEVVKDTPVKLYIGHGVYRLGASKSWPAGELADQLRYNNARREIDGSVFFSYRNIFTPSNAVMRAGVKKVLEEYWNSPARVPR